MTRSTLGPWSLCLILLIAVPSAAAGQTSRAEAIAQQQATRATQLAPEQAQAGEVFVKRFMSSPLLAGSGGLYPWFGSVYSGTGLGLGVGYLRRAPRGQRVVLTGAVSTNRSLMVDANWRLPGLSRSTIAQPWVAARWSSLRSIVTYGVGPGTPTSQRTTFDYRTREVNAGVTVRPGLLTLTGSVGYFGFETEGVAHPGQVLPTLGQTLDYVVTKGEATIDWRTSPGYSTRGGFVRGAWQRNDARNDPFSFDTTEIEAAQLVPLVREHFGLAFRALATTTRTADGDLVPFILLPYVGSGDTVRSLVNRRYQDRSRVILTAEYRWRPSRYLDMAIFADSGAVAPRLADIEGRLFRTGYGVGARLHGPAFTAMRVDVAHGNEGWRFVFAAGQPF